MRKQSILLALRRPRARIGLLTGLAVASVVVLVGAAYPDPAPRLMLIFTAVTAVMTAIAILLAVITQIRKEVKK